MYDINLKVSRYANIPTADINRELIRLQDILHELRQDEEANKESIEQVLSNIAFLEQKKKYNKSESSRVTLDKVFRWFLWSLIVIYCLSLIILPIWMILTSFKDPLEFANNKLGLPQEWIFTNFSSVFSKLKIKINYKTTYTLWDMLGFSLIYSFGATFMSVSFTTMMAYIIAKYKFPGRNFLYNLGIVLMIVPIIGSGPSAMMIRRALGLYDNLFLSILVSPVGCFYGLNFLLLYGNFKSLPWDYAEAVFVDGGGHYSAFFKMYLPMALPTMVVIFVLGFLGTWNDYETFMVWYPSTPNLAYGLYQFQGASRALYKSSTTEIMAGFTMVIIPTVALYLSCQKLILSKFTVGGLKG